MIQQLDHLVMTVSDLDKTCEFYSSILGMEVVTYGDQRKALRFGHQKINLHPISNTYSPKAEHPVPGSCDLCFIVSCTIETLMESLSSNGVDIIEGPVKRTGANSLLNSIYIRDPDLNLLELSTPSTNNE